MDAHARANNSGFLERGTATEALAYMSTRVIESGGPQELLGAIIGRYQVRALVGSGGMGSVYEATQENPRRTVALKVMRFGLLSPSALRRFEYEAQVLGRMRHPGIAQVYEAGTHAPETAVGTPRLSVPFIAMELVPEARTITDFARTHAMDTRSRLGLFLRVCEAVQHAHQRGIIHRDLKPSNILIDAYGQPKIIDFGVARIADDETDLATMQTRVGQLIGTLQYMSPEQCGHGAVEVDTRTDVYSLGVVLFELLTGRLPYDVSNAAVLEATRIIRERAPTRPSGIDIALRGDIETIALKALEKDRDRRYQSVADLARDIGHYLAGERISARPASMTYQVRLFTRRHKAAVFGAAGIFLAIIVGLVGTSIGFLRATRERDRALAAQIIARDEARRAHSIAEFLKSAVVSADPYALPNAQGEPGPALPDVQLSTAPFPTIDGSQNNAADLLVAAGKHLESAFSSDLLTRAELGTTIGTTLRAYGRFGESAELLRDALAIREKQLGPSDPDTIETRRMLAMSYENQGEIGRAVPLLERNFELVGGGLDKAELRSIIAARDLANNLAVRNEHEKSLELIDRAYRAVRARRGEAHPITLELEAERAGAIWNAGRREEGAQLLRAAVEKLQKYSGENSQQAAWANWQLAVFLKQTGPLSEAETLLRRVYEVTKARYGANTVPILQVEVELLYNLRRQGRYEEAAELADHILSVSLSVFGEEHHRTIRAKASKARTLLYIPDRLAEAVRLSREAADGADRILAPDDGNAWIYRAIYAEATRRAGRPAEAEQILRTLRTRMGVEATRDGLDAVMLHQYTGLCLLDQGNREEAEKELLEAWSRIERQNDPFSEHVREVAEALAGLYAMNGNQEAAEMWRLRVPSNSVSNAGDRN
ncbi:MAG: serine/threonine protein kinase [Planctomycetes bacterium]|nr:serine/threonine protein kinase [Planctomycetota bacterium]